MYQVSEALDAVISGSGRTFYARLNGVQKGIQRITQTSMSTPDDYMYVGSAIASKIEVSMYTRSQDFKDGVELKFEIGASTGNTVEWIPMGYFTIQDSKKDRDLLAFTAYDRIGSLLKEEYKCKLSYPSESKEFLKDISEQTGIQFDLSSLSGDFMIDKILSIDDDENENNKVYKEPFAGFTMQQVVGYIAQLYGKFAVCDRYGKVVFRWYSKIKMESENNRVLDNQLIPIKDQLGNMLYDSEIDFSDDGRLKSTIEDFILDQGSFFIYDTLQYYAAAQTYIVKSNRYFDDLVKASSKFKVTGIGCQTENEYITSGESTELTIENQVMKQEWLDKILSIVKQLSFYPASFSFMGDPRIDVGDIIVVIDADGNPIDVPIMKYVLDFDGGLLSEVSSYGAEAYEIKSPSSSALDRVKDDIAIIKELTVHKLTADEADIKYARLDKVNINEGWITTAMIGDAQITNAKIKDLSADKLSAGTIDANIVKLKNLHLSDVTDTEGVTLDATIKKINLMVSNKVGNDEIISKINMSSEGIQIEADKIKFTGSATFEAAVNASSTVTATNKTAADALKEAQSASTEAENLVKGLSNGTTNITGDCIKTGTIWFGVESYINKNGKFRIGPMYSSGGVEDDRGYYSNQDVCFDKAIMINYGIEIYGNNDSAEGISYIDFHSGSDVTTGDSLYDYTGRFQNYLADNGVSQFAFTGSKTVDGISAGTCTVAVNGTIVHSSDKRLKDSIIDIDYDIATEWIMDLRPVSYVYKADSGKKVHHGLIYQEVQECAKKHYFENLAMLQEFRDVNKITYGAISYEELIADIIRIVQKHEKILRGEMSI